MDTDMMIRTEDEMESIFQMQKLPEFPDFNFQNPTFHDQLPFSSSLNTSTYSPSFIGNSNTHDDKYGSSSFGSPVLEKNNRSSSNSNMATMREMIFRIAAMQPIHIDPESVKPPKRRNVKISKDPQSVAARHRRERISERIRILQRLVPGGTKMDTASMLDEAIHYVKFLKKQVQSLEQVAGNGNGNRLNMGVGLSTGSMLMGHGNINMGYSSSSFVKGCQQTVSSYQTMGNLHMLR